FEVISNEEIANLPLSKAVYLYIGVGLLFLLAAALFYFSKKVPAGLSSEPMEKANKARSTLIVITVLLLAMFIPVFMSYKSDAAFQIESLKNSISSRSEERFIADINTNIEKVS